MPRRGNCRVCGDAVVMRGEGIVPIPEVIVADPGVVVPKPGVIVPKPNEKRQEQKLDFWLLKGLNKYIADIIKQFLKESTQYEYLLTPNPIAQKFVDHLMKTVVKIKDDDALTCYDMMAGTGMESEHFVRYKKNVTLYLGDLDPIVHTFLFKRFLSIKDIKELDVLRDKLSKYMKKQRINIKEIKEGSELSILDIFDYKNKIDVKQAHIIHMDPHWPGGSDFKNPDFYSQVYYITDSKNEMVDITLFVVHLFEKIKDLKVVTVKVAKFIVSDRGAMENNHLIPSIEGQRESTKGYIKDRKDIQWTVYMPDVPNYDGHIRYLIFQRASP